jgi:MHS family proline/betaine transporter-like MFS transporter
MQTAGLRTFFAGGIGNLLEWYDFAVFGYFAPFISAQFFPADDPVAGVINTFGQACPNVG